MDITLSFLSWLSVLIVVGALIAAAISDFSSLTIPNWRPATVAAFYVPFAYTSNMTATELAFHYGLGALIYLIGRSLTFPWGYWRRRCEVNGGDRHLDRPWHGPSNCY